MRAAACSILLLIVGCSARRVSTASVLDATSGDGSPIEQYWEFMSDTRMRVDGVKGDMHITCIEAAKRGAIWALIGRYGLKYTVEAGLSCIWSRFRRRR